MKPAELADVVSDLVARVAALEEASPPAPKSVSGDLAIVQSIIDDLDDIEDGALGDGTILYVGAGNVAGGTVAWQMDRPWRELTGVDPTSIARLLGALGNAQRLHVVQLLVDGPKSTAELTTRLDDPSSGQLFHHLKELLAAGVIYQPERGTYALHKQHIVPLLTVISCGIDLTSNASSE
jgi:DNA-binding transcriptional ArsR family regulator